MRDSYSDGITQYPIMILYYYSLPEVGGNWVKHSHVTASRVIRNREVISYLLLSIVVWSVLHSLKLPGPNLQTTYKQYLQTQHIFLETSMYSLGSGFKYHFLQQVSLFNSWPSIPWIALNVPLVFPPYSTHSRNLVHIIF